MAVIFSEFKHYGDISNDDKICLNFHQKAFSVNGKWKGFPTDKNCVARLILKRTNEKTMGNQLVVFYEGIDAWHAFIKPIHQLVNRQREKLSRQSADNINLHGKLHDMVRIAYSKPRIISLVTVGNTKMLNMFPTDLHGPIGEEFYASSLRTGGKANTQVEQFREIILSDVNAHDFRSVYSLGKNHMQDLKDADNFKCSSAISEKFKVPLPFSVIRYRELRQFESFDIGIHRIHFYKQVNEKKMTAAPTLAHIHQYYAQWRLAQRIPTDLLLR